MTSLIPYESPAEYGLPFDSWRPGQLQAIHDCLEALDDPDIDVVMLIADTGTGKSGIATAISQHYARADILTKTISLQAQYEGIVPGLEIGRGRRWHPCLYGAQRDPMDCWKDEECVESACPYRAHISRVQRQRLRVLNYAQYYALNIARDGFFRAPLVVCDEAHDVENTIQSFCEMWHKDGSVPTFGSEQKEYLFDSGEKFLLMSATMIPALISETMGIEKGRYKVVEAANDFDPDLNPVYVKPVGYITAQRPLVDRLVRFIDNHLVLNPQFNGVVHTASDRQAEDILSETKYRSRFIWPKGPMRGEQIKYFKEHPNEGLVLISASVYEGQDFPDDECRWQIICKVPYASLGSDLVRQRRDERPDIYRLEALQRIQQACGRGQRHSGDWCTNYILDGTVLNLYKTLGGLMSNRFKAMWKGVV